ncbi:MAG: hypothetical protein DI637_06375 [Citromicrobium sp.]|nr:MAG: hypothetical protein DI637_06375 [Citromicrobium sp.]
MSFIPARQGRPVSLPSAPVAPAPAELATPTPDQATEPRARIVAALQRRGEGGPADQPVPDLPAPDLPALAASLSTDPGSEPGADDTRAPQDRFTPELQREFLEALSIVGSVRDAARRVGVSHMSAYRARRKCADFARLWDAAVVLAIPHAEEELTCRAIDGVEEDVMYRGEVVHTRIRKDPRLLLAHLARLDKKAAQPQAAALAACFDDALDALGRGEDLPATAPESGAETPAAISPSGPCNTCNTSPAQAGMVGTMRDATPADSAPDLLDDDALDDGEDEAVRCCVNPDPRECALCPHYPEELYLIGRMADARPADAPDFDAMGQGFDAEQCQLKALVAGDRNWWRIGAGFVLWDKDAAGTWRPASEIASPEADAEPKEEDEGDAGEVSAHDEGEPPQDGAPAEPAEPARDSVTGPRIFVP